MSPGLKTKSSIFFHATPYIFFHLTSLFKKFDPHSKVGYSNFKEVEWSLSQQEFEMSGLTPDEIHQLVQGILRAVQAPPAKSPEQRVAEVRTQVAAVVSSDGVDDPENPAKWLPVEVASRN